MAKLPRTLVPARDKSLGRGETAREWTLPATRLPTKTYSLRLPTRSRKLSTAFWTFSLGRPSELHLGTDILVPDLAGWRTQRLQDDDEELLNFIIAPNWRV